MKLNKVRHNILPLIKQTQAAHLLLQSGLTSAAKDISKEELIARIVSVENPTLSADVFSFNYLNVVLQAAAEKELRLSFVLSFSDLNVYSSEVQKILSAHHSVHFLKSKKMTDIEIRSFREMLKNGYSVKIVFVETKEENFKNFLSNTPSDFFDYVSISYLPKLNEWDALLSPLEVAESLDAITDIFAEKEFGNVIFLNEELKASSLSRSFYLDPSKAEYARRSFGKSWFVKMYSFYAIVSWILSQIKRGKSFVKEVSRVVVQAPKRIPEMIYWGLRHVLLEAKSSLWNFFRYGLINGSRDLLIKIFWRIYPIKGMMKIFAIRCYWTIRNTLARIANLFRVIIFRGWRSILVSGFWRLRNSWVFRPFMKIYWFLEYQFLKRILGKEKNEY